MRGGVSEGEVKCIEDLVGKPEGKRLLGRFRHRWEYDIKMDLKEMGWGMAGLIRVRTI